MEPERSDVIVGEIADDADSPGIVYFGMPIEPSQALMAAAALAMAEDAAAFASRLEKREIAPAGDLRIATSDALLQALLTPILAEFREAYPEVRLELALGTEPFSPLL